MTGGQAVGLRGTHAPTREDPSRRRVVLEREESVRRSRLPWLDVIVTTVRVTYLDDPGSDGFVTYRRRIWRPGRASRVQPPFGSAR